MIASASNSSSSNLSLSGSGSSRNQATRSSFICRVSPRLRIEVASGLPFLFLLLLAGCATNEQFVHFPDQQKRVEDPGKARIYVARPNGLGGMASMEIWDTGKHVANTGPWGFVCWERLPGKAEVTGREENNSTVEIDAEAGEVYFIQQHIREGWWQPRNKLEILSEEDGRHRVKQCKPPKPGHCFDHPECRSSKPDF